MIERFAFGHPTELTGDRELPAEPRSGTALIGRILLGAIFIVSGFAMLTSLTRTAGFMASIGIPAASGLAIVAGCAEVVGGLAITFGFLSRVAALGLIVLLIPTTLLFHHFWDLSGADRIAEMTNFLKNLAIIGGLSLLVAHGPGRYSLDSLARRPRQT